MILPYNTRDENGKELYKEINIAVIPPDHFGEYICGFCGEANITGISMSKIFGSSFTDWSWLKSEYSCVKCYPFTKLYFYNYIVNGDSIRLLNVREMEQEILKPQEPPFKIVITTSRKKHLFYKSVTNYNPDVFTINLEEQQIKTSLKEQRELFAIIGALQALGNSKRMIRDFEYNQKTLMLFGVSLLNWHEKTMRKQAIQIPLFISQKNNEMKEEEAICYLSSILTT